MPQIKINGVIGGWDVYPEDVVAEINNQSQSFEILLNSIGGSVMGGISIANAIREKVTAGVEVTVIVDAVSASIASYFMVFATKVIVHDNTTVMIHNAWLPIVGDFNELRKGADISEGLSSILAKAYIAKTGKTEDDIKSLMNEETYYYGADIVKNGFANEIITTDTDTTEAEAKALAISSLEACNNAILLNEKISIEAVAKLIPKKDEEIPKDDKKHLEELANEKRLADLQAKQKRDRKLSLLKRKV